MKKIKIEDNFFDQMKNYKYVRFKKVNFVITLLLIIFYILTIISLFSFNANLVNRWTIVLLWVSIIGMLISLIVELICWIQYNIIRFRSGKFSSGLVNLFLILFFVYLVVFVLSAVLPEERRLLIPAIIAAVAALFASILALFGIHYTMTKKSEERMYKNKLVFVKSDSTSDSIEYNLHMDIDSGLLNVCVKNVSNNFGFLCGIYSICGCDIYAKEEKLPYFPIEPKTSYYLKNISYKIGDEQLLIVYKDIENKYYYINIHIISSKNYEIINNDVCDMEFVQERLKTTKRIEERLKNKYKKACDIKENYVEEYISINKEETKPKHTKQIAGYEIILDENDNVLTDIDLLEKLKKERLSISRANKIKAFMIFTNQQLVALATYKPTNYERFISIYGLGEGKYKLYGECFVEIIIKHMKEKMIKM